MGFVMFEVMASAVLKLKRRAQQGFGSRLTGLAVVAAVDKKLP